MSVQYRAQEYILDTGTFRKTSIFRMSAATYHKANGEATGSRFVIVAEDDPFAKKMPLRVHSAGEMGALIQDYERLELERCRRKEWEKGHDIAGAKKRERKGRWNAKGLAKVTHGTYGSVVVPCASPYAALRCAAEHWGCDWSEICEASVMAAGPGDRPVEFPKGIHD